MSESRPTKQAARSPEQKRSRPTPAGPRPAEPAGSIPAVLETPQGLVDLPYHPTTSAVRQAAAQRLQRSHGNQAVQTIFQTDDLGARIKNQSGQGSPLGETLQNSLESHLEADLSRVRLHTSSEADLLARRLSARAFTTGADIFFQAGALETSSVEGQRLLAHEVTHAVQQSNGTVAGTPTTGGVSLSHPQDAFEQAARASANHFVSSPSRALLQTTLPQFHSPVRSSTVQRQPAPGGGGSGGGGNNGGGGGSVSSIEFKGHTLKKDVGSLLEVLNNVAIKDGISGASSFTTEFASKADQDAQIVKNRGGEEGGSGSSAYSVTEQEAQLESQIKPILQQQFATLKKESDDLVTSFEGTAKSVVMGMLGQSKTKLEQEKERYGAEKGESVSAGNQGAEGAGPTSDTVDTYQLDSMKGLDEAAKILAPMRKEIDDLNRERDSLVEERRDNNTGPMPSIIIRDQARYDEITTRIGDLGPKYEQERVRLEQEYPILAAYTATGKAEQLSQIAKGQSGEGGAMVGQLIFEQLANIDQVTAAIDNRDLDVWTLDTVIAGAKAQMGFSANTLGGKVVDDYRSSHNWNNTFKEIAIGVIGLALGIVAALPTAGASLAAGAAVAGGALSTYTLMNSIKNYQLANAMSGTDPDKARALSQEDPSLFWLALEIVGSIGDVSAAIGAFRTVRSAIRGAEALESADDVRKTVKSACDSAGVPNLAPRIADRLEKNLKLGDEAMEKMRAAAKDAYSRISPEEKAKLLEDGVPEEKFIEQMVSNTRRDIVVSGEEGVRRAGLVTDLMQPNNPRIQAILGGDFKAMDALLIEHGNWQQLMSHLGSGSPEMKQAALKLMERRQTIVEEVDMLYRAKLAGKPSTEATSDVDLSTMGTWDAGAAMIEAEKYVRDRFGPGWSDALRMNFYTMADRLTMYAKEMPNLSPAERALMLSDLSAKTDKYTVAKMMEYAGNDPASIKRVEEYAKTLGVNTADPEIQKMYHLAVDPTARLAERNRLITRADELMKKYDALPPNASPQERMELAQEISENQMKANFFTEEAYIGPGAGRMVVEGVKVVGFEAKMAVTSQLSMVAHEVSKYGGNVVEAMREYEIYKYINRFAEAARTAGSSNPRLAYFENLSFAVYKRERGAMSDVADVGSFPKADIPEIGKVTDQHLTNTYNDFNAFSHAILQELDVIAGSAPAQWNRFNVPRPAAGMPPTPK